jgi:hypothetical protein
MLVETRTKNTWTKENGEKEKGDCFYNGDHGNSVHELKCDHLRRI